MDQPTIYLCIVYVVCEYKYIVVSLIVAIVDHHQHYPGIAVVQEGL